MVRPAARLAAILLVVAAMAGPAGAQSKPGPPPMPAIGSDWNDGATRDDRIPQASLWPREDAIASGLDDMIHDEDDAVRASADMSVPEGGRLFRALRKVGGSYIVVPVFKLHFGRAGGRP